MSFALSNRQIFRAAVVVVLGFLASGVLGLVRTAVFSSTFGAGDALDAFTAANRVPELLYVLVAGGALGSSFIPVFARFLANGDETSAWRLASAVMSCTALVAAVFTVVVALLAPVVVPTLLIPGKAPQVQALTTALTQLMLITVVIFTVSGLLMGILNARQLFLLPSLALSMNNLGQIFGALVLVRLFPMYGLDFGDQLAPHFTDLLARGLPADHLTGTYGLALGAVLGAALHLAIQLPGLPRVRAKLRLLPNPRIPGVREVLLLMLPRVFGLAVTQINFLVNILLTSYMVQGSLTALTIAWTLMFFVLGVIAQSVGTAVFPSLSALAAEGNLPGFKDRLASVLRGVLFLALPATAGLIVLGQPAIRVVYERGAWTAEHSEATAWALSFYALGIAGHALLEVLSRAFYALSDTKTPVLVGIGSMVANIVLSLIFIRFIGEPGSLSRGEFAGLALANSLTTLLEGAALWLLLRRRIGGIQDRLVLDGAARALIAAVGMAVAVLLALRLVEGQPALITTIFGLLVGLTSFFLLALVLGIDEARNVPLAVLRRGRR
jgi:putative peptidoglycan lipid II flippase